MMESETLFEMPKASVGRIDVLPVSVLEIASSCSDRRENGGHDSNSSRSEYSHFPTEVSSLCLDLYLRDCKLIFDPFAGWGERHSACKSKGVGYIGYDISRNAIERAEEVYGVKNIVADSCTADIPEFDGLITCPPYWNLEKYNGGGIDACNSWKEFLEKYRMILERCVKASKAGAKFCIMVGDWRNNHKYYDLSFQTMKIMTDAGLEVWDEVIVSRRTISKIKIMIPQAVRLGYTVKVHENLLVFKKN